MCFYSRAEYTEEKEEEEEEEEVKEEEEEEEEEEKGEEEGKEEGEEEVEEEEKEDEEEEIERSSAWFPCLELLEAGLQVELLRLRQRQVGAVTLIAVLLQVAQLSVGPGRRCSPRHTVLRNSRDQGSKRW